MQAAEALKSLRKLLEEERVIWAAERDVLSQQIQSLNAELNEAQILARERIELNSAQKAPVVENSDDDVETLKAECRHAKEELEVVAQVMNS